MKRVAQYKKLFQVEETITLSDLKKIYRKLVKEWHPDKFQDGDPLKEEAELKSTEIIDAYHFLVSIAPETKEQQLPIFTETITTSMIADFHYKGLTLKVTFQNGSVYEFFGVSNNHYKKLTQAPSQERYARRHIFSSHIYRNVMKSDAVD
jgi:DnaJ-class molecular chaperone